MTDKIDLSVIVTFHDEEYLVGATIGSLLEAIERAQDNGVGVEVCFALDNPSAVTETLVTTHASELGYTVLNFQLGDQGLVRNECIKAVSGEYIALLDGDDLFGYDWLWKGVAEARAADRQTIMHPEINMYFEGHQSIFVHCSSEDPQFDYDYIRVNNYWDAMCLTHRSVFESFQYRERNVALGFAYEDWDWNMRTLAAGYRHNVVKDTIHFKRRRKKSQSMISRKIGAIYYPNELSYYDNRLYAMGN